MDLKIQLEQRCLRAGTADQNISLTPVLFEHLVAVVGFAGEVGRQASAAITQFARGFDTKTVTLEHADDRLADRDIVLGAAPSESDTKRAVFVGNQVWCRCEVLAMDAFRRPLA